MVMAGFTDTAGITTTREADAITGREGNQAFAKAASTKAARVGFGAVTKEAFGAVKVATWVAGTAAEDTVEAASGTF
jgi:hypothetical protein